MTFKKSVLLLLLISYFSTHAQEVKDTTPVLKVTLSQLSSQDLTKLSEEKRTQILSQFPELADKWRRMNYSNLFFNTVNYLEEPSTLSPIYLNYYNVLNGPQSRKQPFVLDADIKTPIPVGGKYWTTKKRNFVSAVHLTPQFKVRIFRNNAATGDTSTPVRTPSYMPGITWYMAGKKIFEIDRKFQNLFGIRVFHHSNGQDQPEFDTLNRINLYNGNFGDHAILEFLWKGIYHMQGKKKERQQSLKPNKRYVIRDSDLNLDLFWTLGYQYTPYKWSNEVFRSAHLYARHRVNLETGLIIHAFFHDALTNKNKKLYQINPSKERELIRITLRTSYIADPKYSKGNLVENSRVKTFSPLRFNAILTGYWRITGTPYSALFLQFAYYGSDPYNIYFQQQGVQIRGGIALGFYKYPKQ